MKALGQNMYIFDFVLHLRLHDRKKLDILCKLRYRGAPNAKSLMLNGLSLGAWNVSFAG